MASQHSLQPSAQEQPHAHPHGSLLFSHTHKHTHTVTQDGIATLITAIRSKASPRTPSWIPPLLSRPKPTPTQQQLMPTLQQQQSLTQQPQQHPQLQRPQHSNAPSSSTLQPFQHQAASLVASLLQDTTTPSSSPSVSQHSSTSQTGRPSSTDPSTSSSTNQTSTSNTPPRIRRLLREAQTRTSLRQQHAFAAGSRDGELCCEGDCVSASANLDGCDHSRALCRLKHMHA